MRGNPAYCMQSPWEKHAWNTCVKISTQNLRVLGLTEFLHCDNQLQKYLRHCTVFCHKWPVHDLVLVIPPPPLIKVASNTRPYSKLGGTTLNGREEGGQYYILQTCDQERFEARKVVFPWECLIIFATGCSISLPEWQAVKMIFFAPWHGVSAINTVPA